VPMVAALAAPVNSDVPLGGTGPDLRFLRPE
jgi:hypothetical protein